MDPSEPESLIYSLGLFGSKDPQLGADLGSFFGPYIQARGGPRRSLARQESLFPLDINKIGEKDEESSRVTTFLLLMSSIENRVLNSTIHITRRHQEKEVYYCIYKYWSHTLSVDSLSSRLATVYSRTKSPVAVQWSHTHRRDGIGEILTF